MLASLRFFGIMESKITCLSKPLSFAFLDRILVKNSCLLFFVNFNLVEFSNPFFPANISRNAFIISFLLFAFSKTLRSLKAGSVKTSLNWNVAFPSYSTNARILDLIIGPITGETDTFPKATFIASKISSSVR